MSRWTVVAYTADGMVKDPMQYDTKGGAKLAASYMIQCEEVTQGKVKIIEPDGIVHLYALIAPWSEFFYCEVLYVESYDCVIVAYGEDRKKHSFCIGGMAHGVKKGDRVALIKTGVHFDLITPPFMEYKRVPT